MALLEAKGGSFPKSVEIVEIVGRGTSPGRGGQAACLEEVSTSGISYCELEVAEDPHPPQAGTQALGPLPQP